MWSIFTLLALGTVQAQTWASGGDKTNPQDLANNRGSIGNSRGDTLAPIRIDYDLSRLTNPDVLAAVSNAIPLVNAYLTSTLKVFPIVDALNLGTFNCGGKSYNKGSIYADFYIIFEPNVPNCVSDSSLCTHGFTRSCHVQNNLKNNAIGGIAYISTDLFNSLKLDFYQQWTFILHQAIHLLGFSEELSKFWEGCTPGPKCTAATLKFQKNVRINNPKTFLISPRVVLETKNAFGSGMDGAELEEFNGIGYPTIPNSNVINFLDARIFTNDIMAARGFHEMIVSTVTLAVLYDTNWYDVNFNMGQVPIWGRQEECRFTAQKCIVNLSFAIQHRYWCVKGGQAGCDAMRTHKGTCLITVCSFSNKEFDYFKGGSGGEKFTDYCPYIVPVVSGDCRLETNANNNAGTSTSKKLETYGKSSRCFEHNLVTGDVRDLAVATACLQVDCSSSPNYKITIVSPSGPSTLLTYTCPDAGGFIRVPEWKNGWVKCWPRNEVCDDAPCCNLCSGRGSCVKGFCQCNDKYSGTCCEKNCEPKCLKCLDENTCTKCEDGYYLENGDCKKCIEPCTLCKAKDDCIRCSGQDVLYTLKTDSNSKGYCDPICPTGCSECVKPDSCVIPEDGKCFDLNGIITNCCSSCTKCSKTRCCECTECKTGYFLTSIGTCTNQCAVNCKICATIYDCATCNPGFILNEDKKCIRCPPNCDICDDTCPTTCVEDGVLTTCDQANCFDSCPSCTIPKCTKCSCGYTLQPSGECIRNCPQNCKTCTSATNCTVCNGGFALNETTRLCVPCEIGCISCLLVVGDNTKTNCKSCYCGYYLGYRDNNPNDGDCINCMPGCVSCLSHQTCESCSIRWWLDFNGDQGCKRCEYGCKRCNDLFSCLETEIGYFLSDNQSPIRCHKSCYTCGSDLICKSCIAGYFFYECTSSNCLCRYCEPNCARCSGPIECVVCRCGYYLAGQNECRPCDATCYSCDRAGACNSCRGGYFLDTVTRLCKCCARGCVSCVDYDHCRCCAAGWWPDEYVCKPCPDKCALCWTATDCYACVCGWWLDRCTTCLTGPVCKQCDPKCIRCNSLIDCHVCRSTYFLREGLCVSCGPFCSVCQDEDKCTICFKGYYLGSDRKCYKCAAGCVDCCDENTCLCPATGFYLSNFVIPDSIKLGTKALPCEANCRVCADATNCTLAASGYYLENKRPYKCPDECTLCNNPGFCTRCVNRRYLDNGRCILCDDNCNACDRFGCITAKTGYYISVCPITQRNIPFLCKSPCTTCVGEGEYDCLGCRASYGWINNPDPLVKSYSCLPCNNNCRTCGRQPICTSCNTGYYIWRDGSVIKCPDKCTVCKATTDMSILTPTPVCTACTTSFGVFNGECVACPDKCNKCSNNKCDICSNEYYVTPTGSCAPCTNDCFLCGATSSSCTACKTGFYLTSNPGSCLTCMDNCLRCANANICTCCKGGYFFDIGGEGNPPKCTYCGAGCRRCANLFGCTIAYEGYYIDWSVQPPVSKLCKDAALRPWCRLCTQTKDTNGNYDVQCSACSSARAKIPYCK